MNSSNKIRILFIHHASGWGGAPINILNIINALDKNKFEIEVLLLSYSNVYDHYKKNNVKVSVAKSSFYKYFYVPYTHSVASKDKLFRLDIQLKLILSWILNRIYFAKKELDIFNVDIIHLNSSFLTDWLKPCSKKSKVVVHIQEPISFGNFGIRHSFFTNQMNKYATEIIAISNDNIKRLNLKREIHLIPNFVTKNYEQKKSFYSKYVLYLGGALEMKGFFTVVNSLKYLDSDIKILFCGNYPSYLKQNNGITKIKDLIKNFIPYHKRLKKAMSIVLNHPNSVYIGLEDNPEHLIEKAEFVISPFTRPHFSRPVIEAYAHRKCVIGSNVEGMDEIIIHNYSGLLVEKNNEKELARTINSLHKNNSLREFLGNNGYNLFLEKYSNNNIYKLEKIYNKMFTITENKKDG